MYRKPSNQLAIDDFILPFSGKLRADNRWVKLAAIIPWDVIEERYASLFNENNGTPAKPARMALGSLIIKDKCGYSDTETVKQITDPPLSSVLYRSEGVQNGSPF